MDGSSDRIGRRSKIIAYVAVWLVALFATDPSLGLWALAWMFPLGLFALIPPSWQELGGRFGWWAASRFYVDPRRFLFPRPRKSRDLFWFAILVLLLVGNVAGCRSMNHPH